MDVAYESFLGPHGENVELFAELVGKVLDWQTSWRSSRFPQDPSLYASRNTDNGFRQRLETELNELLSRLEENPPYPHPRYVAQMLKDPGIPALLGYLATMMMNPNNHAYEGGPATTEMEIEIVEQLKGMLGFDRGWGHLTSGGTLANMEALWAVRDTVASGAIAFSAGSHYSWKRICSILRIDEWVELPVDRSFRLDANALEDLLRRRRVAMVMANLGTTGTGSVDPLPEILDLRERYGFHLHVDAAYGGYARAAILNDDGTLLSHEEVATHMKPEVYRCVRLLDRADSVTIDPHKHGLTMYGAGGLIFKEERFRQTILNTAPYTYHVKDKPNIGMFTLEGSRPGAAAAACWLTHRMLPLNRRGLGAILAETLATAREFASRLPGETGYTPLTDPDLDIVCFHPKPDGREFADLNTTAEALYQRLSVENPAAEFILSKFVIEPETAGRLLPPGLAAAGGWTTLRAVFIKHWMRMGPKPTYLDRLLHGIGNTR